MKKIQSIHQIHPGSASIHGGHSGQFCLHARDRLEDIIKRYIELGFAWGGHYRAYSQPMETNSDIQTR